MSLTAQQAEVVNSDAKKIVVLSCAGSGKTTVITQRILRLCQQGVNPEEILALTFSNKAACEMRTRIYKEDKNIGSKIRPNVKTFHSFGLDIIKRFDLALGFTGPIKIIKGNEINAILKDILKGSSICNIEGHELPNEIRARKSFDGKRKHLTLYDDVFEKYCEYLKKNNLVDYDDMIWLPVNYLQNCQPARELIAKQYKYIFVDEYQDTNEGQNLLLNCITTEDTGLCLVGDDDQAIYEWRGAKPEYIRNKAGSKDYELLKLETNFRSQDGIIQVANALINKNKFRIAKEIKASRDFTYKPIFAKLADQTSEAAYVAEKIAELVSKQKYNPSDIAILMRDNDQAGPIIEALETVGIDYDTCEFDENAQYTQFIHVLHSIIKLESSNDLSDALNFPERCFDKFNFIDAKKAYCDYFGQNSNFSVLEWIDRIYLSEITFENSQLFRERYALITQLHSAKTWKPSQVISIYINYMLSRHYNISSPEKFHFVLQVFDIAKNYEETFSECTLESFVEHLELTIGEYGTAPAINLDSINLLTMHRAKGLEFKVVFIVGMQVGIMPKEYFINSEYDLEAERRLFYVALTRAKELLFITSYKDPFGASGESPLVHHGFMAEIPQISYSGDYDFKTIIRELPNKDTGEAVKPLIEVVSEVTKETVLPIKSELSVIEEKSTGLRKVDKEIGLKDLSSENIDEFFEQSLALSKDVVIPDDKFVVIVGATKVKANVVSSLFKSNSIKKPEMFDYDGKGFNINKYVNNFKCIGIILGPQAHKMSGVDATSLKGKILESPEAFPFMVDLIDRRITKKSLQEAIVKIKWNYAKQLEN